MSCFSLHQSWSSEGRADRCRDVEVHTPFAVDSITHSIIKTYLDTTGRPTVTLKKSRCTENHAETIYVSPLLV